MPVPLNISVLKVLVMALGSGANMGAAVQVKHTSFADSWPHNFFFLKKKGLI